MIPALTGKLWQYGVEVAEMGDIGKKDRNGYTLNDGSPWAGVSRPCYVILYREQSFSAIRLLSLSSDNGRTYYAWTSRDKASEYARANLQGDAGTEWVVASLDDLYEFAEATFRLVDNK